MTTESLEVRDLTSVDHDQAFGVRTRSFGKLDDSMREWWDSLQDGLIAQRRLIGVFDGGRLVAQVKSRPFQQFWGGRAVPMSGIAGVVVAPEYRGRGVASLMMRAIAERSVELGDFVSALYPATVAPYRRTGWEVVGAQTRITIDSHHLRGLGAPDVFLRPGAKTDVRRVQELLEARYTTDRANGPKLLTTSEIAEALGDDETFSYFTDDGFVLYQWQDHDLLVTAMVAPSGESARALWGVVGSGSSVAKKVHAFVSPDDPVHLLLPEEVAHEARHTRWMLRLLDASKAMSARGFPDAVSGAAKLIIEDPMLPGCDGAWVLEVHGGLGSLTRAAAGGQALRIGPKGLACLYSGSPMQVLRTAGLATAGSPTDDAFLDSAFGGRMPYLLEYF